MCRKGVDMTFLKSINDFYFDVNEIWELMSLYESEWNFKFSGYSIEGVCLHKQIVCYFCAFSALCRWCNQHVWKKFWHKIVSFSKVRFQNIIFKFPLFSLIQFLQPTRCFLPLPNLIPPTLHCNNMWQINQ